MSANVNGVNLTLMIGPAEPVAVPAEVLDALDSVKVISKAVGTSGFELVFKIDARSPLQTLFLVGAGASIPLVRVVVAVTVSGQTSVLIDGVMTTHSVSPDVKNGMTTLTISGEDLSRVMDYIDFSGIPFPAMPPELQVLTCLAKYALFGVIPMVIPCIVPDISIPIQQILRQQGTDLAHIRRLAEMVGYVFYLVPGPAVGSSVGYWGPQIKWGPVQPALSADADAFTNVDSLSFAFSNEDTEMPILIIQEPITKAPIPIPIPNINPLTPPLGVVPPIPKHFPIIDGVAKLPPVRAVLSGFAKQAQAADAVTANGSLDVLRYGQVLGARHLVGIRGAGMAFDGLWYVTSVTHHLKRGEYKQDFTLSRNGLISTLPSVAV
ncbi:MULTISPECIES: hypothetical protein [unclassified Mycolicibacterium]|uniref:hypothetical protein n=1 Tax=unclassified Mycolicibacterium TaxID=2636767 RepID=UPI00192E6742|nr:MULTISPECIES: hypothetical protein [unclassified Mycolicibacterium]